MVQVSVSVVLCSRDSVLQELHTFLMFTCGAFRDPSQYNYDNFLYKC